MFFFNDFQTRASCENQRTCPAVTLSLLPQHPARDPLPVVPGSAVAPLPLSARASGEQPGDVAGGCQKNSSRIPVGKTDCISVSLITGAYECGCENTTEMLRIPLQASQRS